MQNQFMKIEICSKAEALELAEKNTISTSVISITSLEWEDVVFPDHSNILSVLHLKFNDITSEYDEEGIPYGSPLPKREDLAGLKSFVDALECDCLIIHCYEGRSRSAAVAKAVYEYRGRLDTVHAEHEVSPNVLVYELARQELGNRW